MRRPLLLILLVLLPLVARAETLTNVEVIALHRAGISSDVIVQKISTSTAAFDTSTAALIALKEAGVPEAVITAMLQAKPSHATAYDTVSTTTASREAPLPGPHFAKGDYRMLWNGNCKVAFTYSNKELYIGGETCRGDVTHQWENITAVCFTFWSEHPGKPRNGRIPWAPSRKAEVDVHLRDGRIITYGSIYPEAIHALKKDFEAGYPEIIRCDTTYD